MPTKTFEASEKYKVVVVEDSRSDALLIVEGLKRDGRKLNIVLLPDGEKASNHFVEDGDKKDTPSPPLERPDLILLDLNLPKKGGMELIAEIKSSPRLQGVPLVIFSGSDQKEEVWRCYALGANLVVLKPHDVEPFLHVVQAIEHYCLDVVGSRGGVSGGGETAP
jgi:two-component system, chemotaxis family, response regulator Rcp1